MEKWDIPSLRKSPLGPSAGVRMFPHHWCALSWAVTRNVASVFASFLVRNPMFSLNVMLVAKPWAYPASAGNSESLSSFHGYGRNHSEYHRRAASSVDDISSMLYGWTAP